MGHLRVVPVLAPEPYVLPSSSFGCRENPSCGSHLCIYPLQWFEEKLQEVECEDQRLRKLHAVVETLVNHRKGDRISTVRCAIWAGTVKPCAVPGRGHEGRVSQGHTLPRRWDSAVKDSVSSSWETDVKGSRQFFCPAPQAWDGSVEGNLWDHRIPAWLGGLKGP